MAATYTQITLDEMNNVLKADKGWKPFNSHKEYVYDWCIPGLNGVVIRVYTSVAKLNDQGRRCGGDAIRVCAVNTVTDRGLVKSRRVHRTQGWRDNLKSRVLDTIKVAKERA